MDLWKLAISAKLTKDEGGGGEVEVEQLNVVNNGTYSASSGHAYNPVVVSVPASGITPSGTSAITANGIYDVTNYASVSVSVPASGITPTGTSSITSNGIYDITSFASVDVQVSGGGGDHTAEDGIVDRSISGFYENSRVSKIAAQAFVSCTKLTGASFPNLTGSIGSSAFNGCTSLMSLYVGLNRTAVVTVNKNPFMNTPMANSSYTGSFGSIYVPASLVDSYKASNNWSAYADRITSYVE